MAPSVLRYHEISEAGHRILNPFTEAKLALVGELCRLAPGDRLLDLAVERWLAANPGHEDAPWIGEMMRASRREYLAIGRRYLGWGVFLLRPCGAATAASTGSVG